jgi:hypothetical protein
LAVPVVALGGATAYAMYHPLSLQNGPFIAPGVPSSRKPVTAPLMLENTGGRPLRVLAIEPGDERGYALHAIGAERQFMGVTQGGDDLGERPLALPFTIAPHKTRSDLLLHVSRAGCRPWRLRTHQLRPHPLRPRPRRSSRSASPSR